MRPVAPRLGLPEMTIAEDQLEYLPLVAAVRQGVAGAELITRWRLTDEERGAMLAGADLYVRQLTFGQPMQPLAISVGAPSP